MTACDRFESEGLARFVAGQPLDAHFASCADCQAAKASYQAVAQALKQAREAYVPPGDWEAKVWARIQRGAGVRQRARWPVLLGFGATLAAVGVFFVTSMGGPDALMLATTLEPGSGPVVRGEATTGEVRSGAPGNIWHFVVKVPRGKHGDLRVYRGTNELVFQCATHPPACIQSKDGLEAKVKLDRTGTYRTLTIAADKELPAATGSLDADYAAALRSGADVQESLPFNVL